MKPFVLADVFFAVTEKRRNRTDTNSISRQLKIHASAGAAG